MKRLAATGWLHSTEANTHAWKDNAKQRNGPFKKKTHTQSVLRHRLPIPLIKTQISRAVSLLLYRRFTCCNLNLQYRSHSSGCICVSVMPRIHEQKLLDNFDNFSASAIKICEAKYIIFIICIKVL